MGKIIKKMFVAGDTADAALLNDPYDSLATEFIEADNTSKKWANRDFINEGGGRLNNLYHDYNNGFVPFSTNSTTLVTISNGGDLREVNPNYTCQNDVVVRLCANGLTGIPLLEALDYTGGNPQNNQYQIAFKITYDTTSTKIISYGNYSWTAYAAACDNGFPSATAKPINYRNFGLSILEPFPAGTIINKVELQAKVGNAANTLNILRNNLFVVIAEN